MNAALAAVVVAASLSGLACDCPRQTEVVHKRRTVGDIQYQIGSEVMTRGIEMIDAAAFFLGDGDAGHDLSFRLATGDLRQPDSSPPPFVATITIRDLAPGASEIDLDDQRAFVSARPYGDPDTPYHDITGHVSLRELGQECERSCPTRANGTLNLFAVGPNGETFSFTSVTFSAADGVRDGMCLNNG